MVSFYCDACTDTVKKPKLAQHYGKCRASFTCIDCSTTFFTPAEFQKHTTCVSEAEKYQKKLYKGPKHNATQNGVSTKINASGNRKPPTPLPAPSPTPLPADVPAPVITSDILFPESESAMKPKKEQKKLSTKEATLTEAVTPTKQATISANAIATSNHKDSAAASDVSKDKKKKRKRKDAVADATTPAVTQNPANPVSEPATVDQPLPVEAGKKKRKKDKSAPLTVASSTSMPDPSSATDSTQDASVVAPVVQNYEKKRKRKKMEEVLPVPDTDLSATPVVSEEAPLKKKRKHREVTALTVDSAGRDGEVGKKAKAKAKSVVS